MDSGKTLEARLPARESVVSPCEVLLLCICCTCCTCGVVYIWYGVHILYAVMCRCYIYGVVCKQCYVHNIGCDFISYQNIF